MKSVKTINNRNAVTDAILGLDDSSTTIINGNLIGNVSSATTATRINTTDNNTSSQFYLPFVTGVSASSQLFIDSITGPLSYNPSFGTLTNSIFVGDIQVNSVSITVTYNAPVLSFDALNRTLRNGTVIITGTANIISSLSLSNVRNNGIHYIALQNNGSGNLTISTGLGANIKTTYSSAIIIPATGSALMKINVITLNAIQTTIVDVKVLT